MTSPAIRTERPAGARDRPEGRPGEQDEQGDGGEAEPDDGPGPLAALGEDAGGDRLSAPSSG